MLLGEVTGLKTKTRYRPLTLRQMLYPRVVELRNNGETYRRIQNIIYAEFGLRLSKSLISYWCRRCHTPFGDGLGKPEKDHRIHKLIPCPELAYVIGASIGDGFTRIDKGHMYVIVLAVKDHDFAETYGKCAATAVGRDKPYKPSWDRHSKRWIVKFKNKALHELVKKPLDIKRIRFYIEFCEKSMASFIKGFADSEGSVNINDDHLGQIQIANTNLGIIRYTAELLERLGIESKIYKRVMKRRFIIDGKLRIRRKKIIYALTIQRKVNIIRYRSLIGFSIKRKQSVLEMLKDTQRPITL